MNNVSTNLDKKAENTGSFTHEEEGSTDVIIMAWPSRGMITRRKKELAQGSMYLWPSKYCLVRQ